MATRVLIGDAQEIVRLGLKKLLEGTDFRIVAQATTGPQVLEMTAKHKPDVVLMETQLPGFDGLQALSRLKIEFPQIPVLFFAAFDNPRLAARANAMGAAGYVEKTATRNELLKALTAAAQGDSAWTRTDLRRMGTAMASPHGCDTLEASFTARELEIVKLMVTGATNEEIARSLKISYETIKEHIQHILRKLGLEDRTQTALWAIRHGVVPMPEFD